jgi:hypothetical protein
MSVPYKTSGKITHRAWFSPEEYKQLYEATRKRALEPKQPRFRWEAEQLHDYVLFCANTGLRPDEAMRLQFRDVTVIEDEGSAQTILEIEVRGKRGVGYCKSTAGAVRPFERLKMRLRPDGGPGRAGSRTASIMANGMNRCLLIFCFQNGHVIYSTQSLRRKSFAPTATGDREQPTAYATHIFVCACLKVLTSIRSPRTAGPASR